MLYSSHPIVNSIFNDDVTALSIWRLDNPNFVVDLDGRSENALTLSCAAKAESCVNSRRLWGLVPGDPALSATVQTRCISFIRKVANAIGENVRGLPAFRTALLLEMLDVAACLSRKDPALIDFHETIVSSLPSRDFATACAFFEREMLLIEPESLVILQKDLGCEKSITPGVIAKALAGRRIWGIRRVMFFGKCESWDGLGRRLSWPSLEGIDFSRGEVRALGESAFHSDKLKHVKFGRGLIVLGRWSFNWCRGLEKVVLPAGLKEIQARSFQHCSSLVEVGLPGGLWEIGLWAFCG
jgi:hypothetical protein